MYKAKKIKEIISTILNIIAFKNYLCTNLKIAMQKKEIQAVLSETSPSLKMFTC
jgi:hypothetical protein